MMPKLDAQSVQRNYEAAREIYASFGVDTEAALQTLGRVQLSLHCWQGDDVGGFENPGGELTGGIQATGNYPGRARTPAELRADLQKVYSLIPGKHRLALHAFYVDYPEKVERNALQPKHFASWIDWGKAQGIGLDAGLVQGVGDRKGRKYTPTPAPLGEAVDWMADVGAGWDDRLARLKRQVEGD
jgi:L-rhamnose isomerase